MADQPPTARAVLERQSHLDGACSLVVHVEWDGVTVDRPRTFAISLPTSRSWKLAYRLMAAINAQVACVNPFVTYDIYGKSFVESHCKVMGRTLNADLKRLGF